jgi:hypothetical protein
LAAGAEALIAHAFLEGAMTENVESKVMRRELAGLFDAACNRVREVRQARCMADEEAGSRYSVVGPFEAQIVLPNILQQMADTLRGQLAKNLQ